MLGLFAHGSDRLLTFRSCILTYLVSCCQLCEQIHRLKFQAKLSLRW
ncbi:hypothetical protein EVA_07947 [gut metagenome]|uniref:Uncharacterized protein n=1 Tax=gut metagenome TaxID=749906 RepID=J9GNN2_9ZZZZ